MVETHNLVDWNAYWVRSDISGDILLMATIEKFQDHLNHYLMLERSGNFQQLEIPTMFNIDWKALITSFSKNGEFDIKKAVDWFKKDATDQYDRVKAEIERDEKFDQEMAHAIHAAFDKKGGNICPRGKIIAYALTQLGFDSLDDDYDAREAEMEKYLQDKEKNKESFGSLAGPSGGLIRCKTEDGKPTKEYLEDKKSIKFGKVTRGKQGMAAAPSSGTLPDDDDTTEPGDEEEEVIASPASKKR